MMKPKKNKTTLTSQKGNFTNKLKKNTSENVLLKTKIINMEQNLNDHEKILKNLIEKVKPTPKTVKFQSNIISLYFK